MGNAFVQRSQASGGSIIIRGFEASRVVLMVDGVRMNNLIYRAGHLQNIITVDNAILDKVEILNGSASTIYGSDALGGVVSLYTRAPQLKTGNKTLIKGNAFFRYGLANNELTGHTELNIGTQKFASLTAATFSKFSDLRMGGAQNPFYRKFGERPFYADRIDGRDTLIPNNNPLPLELISFTGHAEQNYNVLEWITESEINNDYFTLEKSPDGIVFDTLATIDGAGNSNVVLNYKKTDERPYPHISYYRLKQTDFNGNYKYSRIIPLLHSGNTVALDYTYNADADELTVYFSASDNRQKSLELIDAIGRKICTAITPDAYMKINTATYANGVYFLTMKTGEETKTFKLEFY